MPAESCDSDREPLTDTTNGDLDPRFRLDCPKCGRTCEPTDESCPRCGEELLLAFSGTYQPQRGTLGKALAWTLLLVFAVSMLLLFGIIVRKMVLS